MDTTAQQAPAPDRKQSAAYRNLIMATIGFTLTFWAWNLISPLSGDFKERLGLSSFQQSLLVAVPVLVGSLGRIPAGALTDKFGARLMFPVVSALTIVPVLLLIPAKDSYGAMLAVGFLLGLGGTTFAIGIPLVNSWFPCGRAGPGARCVRHGHGRRRAVRLFHAPHREAQREPPVLDRQPARSWSTRCSRRS